MKLKRAISGAVIAASVLFGAIGANAASISDIDKSADYARQAIANLASRNIISGDQAGNFNPLDPVKRPEMVKMIVNALGLDISAVPQTPTFSDVPADNWAFPYVEAAYKAGIIKGTAPGVFGAKNDCSREEAAAMFVRSLGVTDAQLSGKQDMSALDSFSDKEQISDWARDYVVFSLSSGLMQGTGDGKFSPGGKTERQQVAVITDRYINQKSSISQLSKLYSEELAYPELYRALWNNFYNYKGGIDSTLNTSTTQTVAGAVYTANADVSVKGVVDKNDGDLQIQMDLINNGQSQITQQYRIIKVNGNFYMQPDGSGAWQVDDGSQAVNVNGGGKFLDYYEGLSVTKDGSVDLDGTAATRYTLVLSDDALKVLLSSMFADQEIPASIGDLYNDGYGVTAELYLDAGNRLILEKYDFYGKTRDEANAASSEVHSVFTTRYYDTGSEIRIEAPVLGDQGEQGDQAGQQAGEQAGDQGGQASEQGDQGQVDQGQAGQSQAQQPGDQVG